MGLDDGSGGHAGGTNVGGGSGTAGVGGGASIAILSTLELKHPGCERQSVARMQCQLSRGGIYVLVESEADEDDAVMGIMGVRFEGLTPALKSTPSGGYVSTGWPGCIPPISSNGAPEPCELELESIVRGEPREVPAASGGTAGTQIVEEESRVRLRVSCPGGLYSPGSDDVNAFVVQLVPSEFALEAEDCVVLEE